MTETRAGRTPLQEFLTAHQDTEDLARVRKTVHWFGQMGETDTYVCGPTPEAVQAAGGRVLGHYDPSGAWHGERDESDGGGEQTPADEAPAPATTSPAVVAWDVLQGRRHQARERLDRHRAACARQIHDLQRQIDDVRAWLAREEADDAAWAAAGWLTIDERAAGMHAAPPPPGSARAEETTSPCAESGTG